MPIGKFVRLSADDGPMRCVAPIVLFSALFAAPAYAVHTNQAVYEDPFDIGGGGASLTRASKDGRLFANPALLPYGGTFHKWLGTTTSLLTNKESVDTARTIFNNARSGKSGGDSDASSLVDKVFKDPVRVGWGLTLSWITNNFGLSVFSRFEPDIRARAYGSTGLPEVEFQAESYHGAALGTAIRTPFRWLSLGLTAKYLYVAEPDVKVEVTDQSAIAKFASPDFVQNLASHNKGVGFDVGSLIFLQGNWIDFSLAAKLDDAGNTKLTGPAESPKSFKQVESGGMGLTFHTNTDALHLAIDYRDIAGVYGEEKFKRIYAGAKLLLRTYVGFSAGYYNGYPSYGAEIDLILMRLSAVAYTRELGDHPGADPRHIYMGTLSLGI
jgi:hypothetical protein